MLTNRVMIQKRLGVFVLQALLHRHPLQDIGRNIGKNLKIAINARTITKGCHALKCAYFTFLYDDITTYFNCKDRFYVPSA